MRGVVFPGDRMVSYLDVPDPTPGPLDAVIEMKASGMCGTDLQNYRRPRDQAHPQPFLEGADQFAHARRRQSELLGRLGETFELNHRHKGGGLGETCSMH